MRDVVIIEAGRSPIGKRNGALSGAHPTELLGQVMMEVLKRAGVSPASIGQVVGGCINKVGAQAMSVTRTAWLTAGGPQEGAWSPLRSQNGPHPDAVKLTPGPIRYAGEHKGLACPDEHTKRPPH